MLMKLATSFNIHQHFTNSFSVESVLHCFPLLTVLLRNFLAKELWVQMLMKLTTDFNDYSKSGAKTNLKEKRKSGTIRYV